MNITKQGIVSNNEINEYCLPNEYQQVEYIEGVMHTNAYINTDISVDANTKIVADLQFNRSNSATNKDTYIFGSTSVNQRRAFSINFTGDTVSKTIYVWNGVGYTNGEKITSNPVRYESIAAENVRQLFILDVTGLTVNDYLYEKTGITTSSTLPIWIFCTNSDSGYGANFCAGVILYSFKIYEGETIVADLVPCYRISDNEIGMYDIRRGSFHINQGSGTFSKGSNIEKRVRFYNDKILANEIIEI